MTKLNRVFKLDFPDKKPVYVFSINSWVGLAHTFKILKADEGIIIPITYRQFIKEWLCSVNDRKISRKKNRRT